MTTKAEMIKERYDKGYVNDSQLLRYFQLKAITSEEYLEILGQSDKEVKDGTPESFTFE